jgi:hypothetical protein
MAFEHKPGQGSLWPNDKPSRGEHDPHMTGEINIDGKVYYLSAWSNTTQNGKKWLNVRLGNLKSAIPAPSRKAPDPEPDNVTLPFDDDIPF